MNKTKKLLSDKNYREKNREKINANARQNYWSNRESELERRKKYRETHREQENAYARRYKANSLERKLRHSKRESVRQKLKRGTMKRTPCHLCDSTENLEFHHTNYERNEGVFVCHDCHVLIERQKLTY